MSTCSLDSLQLKGCRFVFGGQRSSTRTSFASTGRRACTATDVTVAVGVCRDRPPSHERAVKRRGVTCPAIAPQVAFNFYGINIHVF